MTSEDVATFPIRKAKQWSRVRVESLGLLDEKYEHHDMQGAEVVFVKETEPSTIHMKDPETGRPIKMFKVWSDEFGIRHLGGDTLVSETFAPRPAGHPAKIAKLAVDGIVMRNSNEGELQTQNDSDDFVWNIDAMDQAVTPLIDPEDALEYLLMAIPVAPTEVLPVLHAALARSYDEVLEMFEDGTPPTWDENGVKLTDGSWG